MITRRKKAFDALFDCYVREGRELGLMEVKRLYPREVAHLRKVSLGSDLRVLLSRMKKIYASRWHEIFEEMPEETTKVSEPTLSPLDALRVATRKTNG